MDVFSSKSSVVQCNVKNCVYNDQNNGCNAETIDVTGPNSATNVADTCCGTFTSTD